MDDVLTLDRAEQLLPLPSKPKPKQLVRFVSGYCQAKQLDCLNSDFSATLEQAFHCIENSVAIEK